MIDQRPTSSESVAEPASRRRLLRLMGAGGAALVATLLPRNRVRAGHGVPDDAEVLHLARSNSTNEGQTSLGREIFGGPGDAVGFAAFINRGRALQGFSEHGVGIWGVSVGGDVPEFPNVGVEGEGTGDGAIGVWGTSHLPDEEAGSPAGSGPGVLGESGSGPGVQGHSVTGTGGHFSTDTGTALSTNGPVAISGDRPQLLLGIENQNTGEDAGAVSATSRGGGRTIEANIFQAVDDPDLGPGFFGIAVQGVSSSGTPEDGGHGDGPGIGVAGFSGTGPGVLGNSAHGPGVVGGSESGAGVVGGPLGPSALAGVLGGAPGDTPGVQALSAEFFGLGFGEPDGGLALEVIGKSRFSTAGSGTVAAGDSAAFVANSAVTAKSHITVSLISDPGSRQLGWIERQPGTGFTVHLTSAPPPQRPETDFTYLIVDMP
ncbi:MAG: hypothetical protein ACRDI2_04795 [Chloroflexota bacterium]